jgi:putative ABC transport system permease protein
MNSLPSWAEKVLRAICPDELYEQIEGDLIEIYHYEEKTVGRRKARLRLVLACFRFLRPGILLRNRFLIALNPLDMIWYYLKMGFRNLMKRKTYSAINIVGLAIGIAACLVIGKYVEFETSFEKFHENGQNIYRVVSSFYTDGKVEAYSGYDLAPNLADAFPEIKRFTRTHGNGSVVTVQIDPQKQLKFKESDILIADSTFFDLFTFRFLQGDKNSALARPNSIVLTKSVALKYFGSAVNAIGKTLNLSDGWVPGLYEVSAVIEDIPANTHLNCDLLLPMHNLLQTDFYRNDHARWDNFYTYVELRPSSTISEINERIPAFEKKYRGEGATEKKSNLQFQPLLDIHYSPELENPGSHQNKIYFFALIAIFILAIAWINYINLSTARAMERAREVGVKKVLGVFKRQLISQFLFESALINLIGIIIALGIAWMTLPLLNQLIEQTLTFDFTDFRLWGMLIILFVIGTLGAGIYPALILSSYKAAEVIKGKVVKSTRGISLRNGLVVFQFAASMLLITSTFVVHRQINFMKGQNKSFETEKIIVIKGPELSESKNLRDRVLSFRNELTQFSFVDKVCTSFSLPGGQESISTMMRKDGNPTEDNRVGNLYWIDPDFIDFYEIPLVAGKTWNREVASEMDAVIINEEAVKVFQLGTNEEALKEKIQTSIGSYSILGVVKNHHWNSPKKPIAPMLFAAERVSTASISIKLKGNIQQSMNLIQSKYEASFPGDTFSYYFLDEAYNSQYKEELNTGKLFSAFSLLAVLVGCLGLWGLASFATLHRLKEIGIRKVLGASVNSILYLLSKQFIKPILTGSLIVLPLSWIGVSRWLDQFPLRIQLTIDLFLIPLGVLMIIALTTISFQTIRAATIHPVKSLKNE